MEASDVDNTNHNTEDVCHGVSARDSRPTRTSNSHPGECHGDDAPFEHGEMRSATEEEDSVVGSTSPSTSRVTGGSLPSTTLKQAILDMKERINLLERQLTSNSSHGDRAVSIEDMLPTSREAKVMFENGVKHDLDERPMIPQLSEKTWSGFMNKVLGENEYAIEVLMEEPEYLNQRSKEAKKSGVKQAVSRAQRKPTEVESTPERIRINSPWILNVLAEIDSHLDPTGSVVMLRPFKFLVHYERQIRDSIPRLWNKLNETYGATTQDQSLETSQASQDIDTTLHHMKCLIDFIDRHIKPTMDRLKSSVDSGRIQFKDLWYIFRPGEDIYMPLRLFQGPVSLDTMMATPETFQARYNVMWRITGTGGGRRNLSSHTNRNSSHKFNPFKANCYYIDFDGKYFCAIAHTFSIMPYTGEREITSLDFFPVRFLREAEDTIAEHLDKGKHIFDNIASSFTHYYYAGPTLVVQPCGCPLQGDHLHQEHVESEVIVDFRMALTKKPEWRPKPFVWKVPPVEERELLEKNPVRYWTDPSKTKLGHTERDHVYDDYYIDKEEAINFKSNERIFAPVPSHWLSNENMVPEKDVLLLPSRAFAFVLRTRTFAPLWLHLLQPIKPQVEGFKSLQLRDDSFKDTVQALVRTHFIQKNTQQSLELEYDMIRGKGKGLVILLHGAPGVGKSFTAESVAAANGKPLFQITCGDLGLTPEEVDKSLKELFRLAQLWDCVLLLDECDIFLTQRSKNDVLRNSLVSVFLKVLEFYTGVLFLTTNRVGVIDDAIKSRITWIAYYPPLDARQTKNIWKNNLKLLEERNKRLQVDTVEIMRFARDHFRSGVIRNSTWNGRQIQNAFKVATSLAEWDAYSIALQHDIDTKVSEQDISMRPVLKASHFNTVAVGTQAFNDYLQEARGYNDAEIAFNNMERADNYVIEEDQGYDDVSVASINENGRTRLPLISLSSSSPHRRRRSSSSTVATPRPYSQDVGIPAGRHRTSSQSQHQKPSLSPAPGHRLTSPTQAKPQSPKSINNLRASSASLDLQRQLPRNGTSNRNGDHIRSAATATAAAITISPEPHSLNPYDRHRRPSNSGFEKFEDDGDKDDDKIEWTESDEEDDEDGDELAVIENEADVEW